MSIVGARMIVLKKNAATPCARQARRFGLEVAFTSALAEAQPATNVWRRN
jgi:hypothetical protein